MKNKKSSGKKRQPICYYYYISGVRWVGEIEIHVFWCKYRVKEIKENEMQHG